MASNRWGRVVQRLVEFALYAIFHLAIALIGIAILIGAYWLANL